MTSPLSDEVVAITRTILDGHNFQHADDYSRIDEYFASLVLLEAHGYTLAAECIQVDLYSKLDRKLNEHSIYRKNLESLRGKCINGELDLFGMTVARIQQQGTRTDLPNDEDVQQLLYHYEGICDSLLERCKKWIRRKELDVEYRKRLVKTWKLYL